MKTSESVKEIVGALSKLSAAPYKKDAVNPFHKSKYVTLDALLDAVKPQMDELGLVLSSWPDSVEGAPGLTTRLMHASGEWMETSVPFYGLDGFKGSSPAQAFGIWTTYMRRYSVSSILNLPGEKDDDGGIPTGAASKSGGNGSAPKQEKKAGDEYEWLASLRAARTPADIDRMYKGLPKTCGIEEGTQEWDEFAEKCDQMRQFLASKEG